jgi:hypothetical protein
MILCLAMTLLCAAASVAQSGSKRSGSTRVSNAVADIRQVDFLNFTYRSSICSRDYVREGFGKTVHVRKGEFKNKNVYFAVADDRIVYADVTGDKREEAIVPVQCGAITANYHLSEVNVFTLEDGRATLLAEISDTDMERDYRRSFPDAESYWGVADMEVRDGNVEIEVMVDGSHVLQNTWRRWNIVWRARRFS